MARPKGSKNKAAEQPKEFMYEDSDALYQQVMSSGAVAPTQPINAPVEVTTSVSYDTPAPAAYTPPAVVAATSFTYFVEGKVRLDQEGSPPIFSDQRRIVNARNADEALEKFMSYFANMSNPIQRYTVVQAGASETIL